MLRDDLGLTGTKFGCGLSVCGACTVLINNNAARACVTPMSAVDGTCVVTIEGLAHDERLNPVQEAFVKHLGFQCGYCTSGMIMGAHALLLKNPRPTHAQTDRSAARGDRRASRCGESGVSSLQTVKVAGAA